MFLVGIWIPYGKRYYFGFSRLQIFAKCTKLKTVGKLDVGIQYII